MLKEVGRRLPLVIIPVNMTSESGVILQDRVGGIEYYLLVLLTCVMLLGWTVVDLGSGAGFDVFLAARKGGLSGEAIGVDSSLVNNHILL